MFLQLNAIISGSNVSISCLSFFIRSFLSISDRSRIFCSASVFFVDIVCEVDGSSWIDLFGGHPDIEDRCHGPSLYR